VAIANSRFVSFEDGVVRFRYRSGSGAGEPRTMQLNAAEFVRRFLLHVLPRGFVRTRHYGLLANASRRSSVELCRSLMPATAEKSQPQAVSETTSAAVCKESCLKCSVGTMVRMQTFRPGALPTASVPEPVDSS